MQQPVLSPNLQWTLTLDQTWDVLGPFPIHAREQHFFTPSFPLNLSQPINYDQSWPSSYADGGLVNWTQASSDSDGNLDIVFPSIRWKDIRAIEGWAALQHHAVLRTSITLHPPPHTIGSEPPRLLVDLKQGSYFALRPYNDSNYPLKWYSGNIYDLERSYPHVVEIPTSPSFREPTKYDLFVSGDYEIRLFGDPLVHQRDFPVQKLSVKVQLQQTSSTIVRQESRDVTCDFVSGFAFGDALGVGVQSLTVTDWWTVHTIRLRHHVPGMILKIKDQLTIAPSQTRSIPINIEQSEPFYGEHVDIILLFLSGEISQEIPVSIPVVQHQLLPSIPRTIQGTFFFAQSMASSFLAVPPQEAEGSGGTPILALHGAGVDILAQDFWVRSLPHNGKSWIVVATGRSSWGLDWHGPSADDAWASLFALSEISRAEGQVFPESWKVPVNSRAIVLGHSNGGQGALYLASRYPDKVLAVIPASGYIKSQAYVPLTLARSGHFIDPALRFILESSLTPDDNDLHLSNLVDTPVLAIHGGDDENVPCWHSREVISTLKAWYPSANIELKEDQGEGHWYSYVLNNPEVDAFLNKVTSGLDKPTPSDHFTLTVTIPHLNGTLHGWSIDEVDVPGRLSRLTVRKIGNSRYAVTLLNVHVFSVPFDVPVEVYIDGNLVAMTTANFDAAPVQVYQAGFGEWKVGPTPRMKPQGSHGRMQNILSTNGPMIIVVSSRSNLQDLSGALRIAHILNTYHSLDSEIVTEDVVMAWHRAGAWPSGNVVFIGTSFSPFAMDVLKLARTDVSVVGPATFVGRYKFNKQGQATLFLHPHPSEESSSCMMFMLYTDQTSLERAMRLFPFRTGVAVPDWLVVGEKMDVFGAGGIEGAGVWNNDWKVSEAMSWFDC